MRRARALVGCVGLVAVWMVGGCGQGGGEADVERAAGDGVVDAGDAGSAGADAAGAERAAIQLPDGAEALGEPITVTEPAVALATVRAHPEQYFEKTILVEATAEQVCQAAGCWMTIADGAVVAGGAGGDAAEGVADEAIWVRWASGCGGKYAFPKDAGGRRVLVQGSFYPKEIAAEDAEHLAGESQGLKAEEIVGKTFEMNATAFVLLPVGA
ncbi:MAG: hypothetical protein DHS20C21_02490 [Gemmatimonadota bacterium]|nr:MAG: hypothetical protein DHS20C21_02490 [Gemmatimonadota bacterium]